MHPPQFRKLDLSGLKILADWARLEGWNPGIHDAEAFFRTDSDGFYGYFLEEVLIGGGSLVSYQGLFGFMGYFMIRPEYRSKGLGRDLWFKRRDALIQRLRPGASIGMDGVPAMQGFYQRGGFEKAFRDIRYQLTGKGTSLHPGVSGFENKDLADILELDRQCFGFDRRGFLENWIAMPNAKTLVLKNQHRTEAFAVVRKSAEGFRIGPLFAHFHDGAATILEACLSLYPEQPFFLDVPAINQAALDLAQASGGRPVFECARMYRGPVPEHRMEKVYGITSFELG